MEFRGPMSNVRWLMLFGISLLLTRNKMTNVSISSPSQLLLNSLKFCIKKSNLHLNSQKRKVKLNLEILFDTVFIGKLPKLNLFQGSWRETFFKKDVFKNFATFTRKYLRLSLIHDSVVGCCFSSLSGTYKR